MSPEISTLVSEYADYLDEIAPPVTVDELESMRGRVSLRSAPPITEPPTRSGWLMAAAAAVVVLLAGALVMWAQRPGGDQAPVITQPDQVVTTLPPTTTTLPETSPTTIPPPDAAPNVGLSWHRVEFEGNGEVVFGGGDRFLVPVVQDNGVIEAIRTSFDAMTWTTRSFPGSLVYNGDIRAVWEDSVLSVTGGGGFSATEDGPIFSAPSTVSVLLLDGTEHRRVFESDVRSAAIGPVGIVVGASSFLDEEEIVLNELGADFASNLSRTELREDDVLYAETNDGRTAEIDLAENGYDIDQLGRIEGWYSSDGQEWSPIPEFPPVDGLVGTRDGFLGINGHDVWHSSDGRAWVNLGSVGFHPIWSPHSGLARWKDGALITDGSEFVYASTGGLEPLPAPPDAIPNTSSAPWPLVATGDVGITFVSVQTGEFLFSADGASWETTNLPADMADSWGWFTSSAAATDTAVLLLLWDDQGTGGQEPVWWLGTLP